jgi:hypothetical protein
VPSPVQFLARLPHARLTCLFLAAAQLMPLPDEPEVWSSFPLGEVRAGPDPWSHQPPSKGGIHMQHAEMQLHQIAQDFPWYTFTVEEIALLCNVSRDVVSKVRAATDTPFFLNKCRPEWFTAWMRGHPDFQLTKAFTSNAPSQESCMESDAGRPFEIKPKRQSRTKRRPGQ